MSTQPNPTHVKAAEQLLATGLIPSKKDFDSLQSLVEKQGKETNDLLQQIVDSKKAPAQITRDRKWVVRSPFTGQKQEMEFSLGKIFHIMLEMKKGRGYPKEAAYGKEVEFVQKSGVSEGSSTAGGSLIPQEWTDFVIPELGAQAVVLRANPNILPMQHQIMNIPGLTNNGSFSWIGENATISTDATPTTNNTTLTLRTAAGLVQVSIQWLRDATPETDAALQANLVRGLARFVDLGYLSGTGSSNQPTGLINVSGISQSFAGEGATNGSTVTYDDFSTQIYNLETNNAPRVGRTWFMHPRTLDEVRRLKDTLGRPLFIDNLQRENLVGPDGPVTALFKGPDGYILGYPVFTSTQLSVTQSRGTASTCSSIIFAAMSDVWIGQGVRSQGMEVDISDQAYFTSAAIGVRLLYRTDIVPGHALSVSACGGIL